MATTIFFNGRVTAVPGSYSEVDVSGLAAVGLGATGIIAAIGEAEGGEPLTPISISNPGKVQRQFRSGDLLEAGAFLFDPSLDADIPGGAQEVIFVKVNPALQSSQTFDNAAGPALVLTSRDWGLFTTQISADITDGTTQGKSITITDGSTGAVEVFDDVGGDPAYTLLYTPGADGADTMLVAFDNTTGLTADFTKAATGLDAEYTGAKRAIDGLDGDKLANVVAGNVIDVVSSNVSDTTQSVIVYGIENGTGNPISETLALNGTTPVVGTVVWAEVHGFVLDAAAAGSVTVNDNGAATALYTAGPAVLSQGLYLFGGELVEVDRTVLALVSDGASTQNVVLFGLDDVAVPTGEVVTLTGTTPVNTTTVWSQISVMAIGYVEAAQDLTISGSMWNQGDTATIVSDNAADTAQTVTIYGLDGSDQPQSEVLTLNGTTPVVGVATWNQIHGAVLSANTTGTTIQVLASTESIVALEWDGSADLNQGITLVDNVAVAGVTIDVADDSADARNVLVIGLDANGAPQVALAAPSGGSVTPTETWTAITGLALAHQPAANTTTISGQAINLAVGLYQTVNSVADFVNALSGWTATVSPNSGELEMVGLDNVTSVTAIGAAVSFTGDLAFVADIINEQSQIVSATVPTGATGAPDNTAGAVFLVGGSEGTTTFADWQAALDLLRNELVNTIVPFTADPAVHAAVTSHCRFMVGPGRKERDACLGAPSGTDLTTAKALAVQLNTRHARLAIQDVERFNTAGQREQWPPYFTAALAAGMQAGSEPGTSLTFKFPNVLDVIGDDASYNIVDDGNELIQSGLLVMERVTGVGHRWLRNVTTHLIDNNIAFVEASVNEAVNVAVFNLRTRLEAAVGRKGFAGTVNAAAGLAIAILNEQVDETIITQWRNLTVTLELDVLEVDVEIAPVLPVNFVKSTVHLVTASISAAA